MARLTLSQIISEKYIISISVVLGLMPDASKKPFTAKFLLSASKILHLNLQMQRNSTYNRMLPAIS